MREATDIDYETIVISKKFNLRNLMEFLSAKYPKILRSYMFDEIGRPINYLTYFINERNAHTLKGFDSEIKEGDVIMIMPSILGG